MDDLMNCLTANSISTSRGNPIAMATGNAVLDFIDSHELQANAVEVGRFLFDGQRGLATRYSLIGEVRGTGLILGFELIEPKTKVPAVAATNAVLAQCRERGLLIGKGGLLGNVLRVTPPMTVTLDEARQALGMLDDVLAKRILPRAGMTRAGLPGRQAPYGAVRGSGQMATGCTHKCRSASAAKSAFMRLLAASTR
nr:aminotransferase class III-fold pyridoxal phosphate-dependent enzyme [Streptomyces antimycoticus]